MRDAFADDAAQLVADACGEGDMHVRSGIIKYFVDKIIIAALVEIIERHIVVKIGGICLAVSNSSDGFIDVVCKKDVGIVD